MTSFMILNQQTIRPWPHIKPHRKGAHAQTPKHMTLIMNRTGEHSNSKTHHNEQVLSPKPTETSHCELVNYSCTSCWKEYSYGNTQPLCKIEAFRQSQQKKCSYFPSCGNCMKHSKRGKLFRYSPLYFAEFSFFRHYLSPLHFTHVKACS